MVHGSTLAQNARDVGSISALGAIFPIFITPMTIIIVIITITIIQHLYSARSSKPFSDALHDKYTGK